jgi:hypothetical protein
VQIPILNGIYTDEAADFRTSYPRNMVPVPKSSGISTGYLRPAEGIDEFADTPGLDRGGINWKGRCYRASGNTLVQLAEDGAVTSLGNLTGDGQVTFDYSFDRLGVASDGKLYYWDESTLQQVTDPDLGNVVDFIWVDGYFMTTDGENLVVTELNDPFSVNPLKYGSSESDPDSVKALIKVRNEPHALNRYTIEAFDNVGGSGFPFQRIDGAQIQRGTIGTHTCCLFLESLAFIGGGRNESIAVWMGGGGQSRKISTREIDQILATYSEAKLSQALVEPRMDSGHQYLYIHLSDQTLVYDGAASVIAGEPVWFILTSGVQSKGLYRARNIVWCYDKWIVGDPASFRVGLLSREHANHWGDINTWEFGTTVIYNEGRGAIFHEIELVCLAGREELGVDSRISTSYSKDGETWSQRKYIKTGGQGQRNKRLVWLQQGAMRNWRIQRFEGTSDGQLAVARLEVRLEPMGV